MKAVANQPVSVAVDGCDKTFQFYSGGIMTGSCGTDLDHGIAAIGYGIVSDGTKYFFEPGWHQILAVEELLVHHMG